jgi:hypothetical protein
MDKLNRQGSWLGGSLSVSHIRSAQSISLPFAAHFASSALTTSSTSAPATNNNSSDTSSLGAPQPSPELEKLFAKMRKHLENGAWEPEDSKALLNLLDEGRFFFFMLFQGPHRLYLITKQTKNILIDSYSSSFYLESIAGWYSKTKKSKRTIPRDSNTTHRPSTAPTTRNNAISNDGQIPALRPLNLSSLHDHTTNAASSEPAIDSGVMFSARSTATARWAAAGEINDWAGLDTPRSWITAASMVASLPQNKQEMDSMDIEEVRQLVEDADVLQQRAAVALKLGLKRLKKNRQQERLSGLTVFFLLLHTSFVLMTAIVNVGLVGLEILARLVAGQRGGKSYNTGGIASSMYSAVGAVAGASQGILLEMSILGK